jgi:hypothetical protein
VRRGFLSYLRFFCQQLSLHECLSQLHALYRRSKPEWRGLAVTRMPVAVSSWQPTRYALIRI